jgi:hypothetical protein
MTNGEISDLQQTSLRVEIEDRIQSCYYLYVCTIHTYMENTLSRSSSPEVMIGNDLTMAYDIKIRRLRNQ